MSDAPLQSDPASTPSPQKPKSWITRLSERLKLLMETYGPVAIVVYFAIFGLVFVGAIIAIHMGFQVSSGAGSAGALGAAYVATKLTQPVRILATLALTPLAARLVGRRPPRPTSPN